MSEKLQWTISILVSIVLLAATLIMLYIENTSYVPNAKQLTSPQAAHEYLDRNAAVQAAKKNGTLHYIPTGIYLESMNFTGKDTARVSGYIWQRYSNTFPSTIKRDFILPEGINVKKHEAYKKNLGNDTVIGWYFEADLIQTFNFKQFPLDKKDVWVRIWPADFNDNTILIPDYQAYASTKSKDAFGLDQDIVLEEFMPLETFFQYKTMNYDTNFGLSNKAEHHHQKPELFFNLILKRNVVDILLSNILPLTIIFALIFAAICTITTKKSDSMTTGFNLPNFLTVCTVLIFALLLSHIKLREIIFTSTVVYLEYIYLIAYAAVLYVIANGFIVMRFITKGKMPKFFAYRDNLIPRLFLLPMITACIFLATCVTFV